MKVREANADDAEFMAQVVLEAEATGSEITSYRKMFDLPKAQLIAAFSNGLKNSPPGHALSLHNFFIVEVNGKPAAGLSAYIEGSNGDSSHLTTAFLMQVIPRNILSAGFRLLRDNSEVSLAKTTNTLQIDCVATIPEYRGKGCLKLLLQSVLGQARQQHVKVAEIQVWMQNTSAIKAYEALGFVISREAKSDKFPGNGKLVMTKSI